MVGGVTCPQKRQATSRGLLQRQFEYDKNEKRVIENVLSNFSQKYAGVVEGSSVESDYVNSPYTIKITIITIIPLMAVTGNCCAFIATIMNMPVIKLPMLIPPILAMNPRIIALVIILLRD